MSLKLIELVKSYNFLYNIYSPHTRSADKEEAWNKIGEELNLPALECQRRWENLRQNYYVRKKTREYRDPQNKEKIKHWKFLKMLSFLDDVQDFRAESAIRIQDDSQNTSLSQNEFEDDSNTEIVSNIEIKDETVTSDPFSYTHAALLAEANINIKDEDIVSDSEGYSNSSGSSKGKRRIKICTIESSTSVEPEIRNQANSFNSSTEGNLPNSEINISSQTVVTKGTTKVISASLPKLRILQPFTLQQKKTNGNLSTKDSVLQPPPKKKHKVGKAESNAIDETLEDISNSSDDFQFSPVSYATSSPSSTPPTTPKPLSKKGDIKVLYEKFENFLDSASTAVKEIQNKPKNSTEILFESLADKITQSNLTDYQINEIEHIAWSLVFGKVDFYMEKNNTQQI